MDTYQGQVQAVLLGEAGSRIAWLRCPAKAVPAPGCYVLAWRPTDTDAALATPLFAVDYNKTGFLAVAAASLPWEPGDILLLRGPLGRGFDVPKSVRRLALGTFSEQAARLFPLINETLVNDAAVALFIDGILPELPPAVEIHPLGALQDALSWADFLILEMPLPMATKVTEILGAQNGFPYAGSPGQVLLLSDMPCGGLADCGVCSLGTGRNWKLVCKDGPVFDLGDLLKLSA